MSPATGLEQEPLVSEKKPLTTKLHILECTDPNLPVSIREINEDLKILRTLASDGKTCRELSDQISGLTKGNK